jgi:hypothetical protein
VSIIRPRLDEKRPSDPNRARRRSGADFKTKSRFSIQNSDNLPVNHVDRNDSTAEGVTAPDAGSSRLARRLLLVGCRWRFADEQTNREPHQREGRFHVRSYVIFSSREPVLVLTRKTIRDKAAQSQLGRIGISKFIAREIPVCHLRDRYGRQFDVIENALQQGGDLRVLDFSGRRIFENLPFSTFGSAFRHDRSPAASEPNRGEPRSSSRPQPRSAPRPLFE